MYSLSQFFLCDCRSFSEGSVAAGNAPEMWGFGKTVRGWPLTSSQASGLVQPSSELSRDPAPIAHFVSVYPDSVAEDDAIQRLNGNAINVATVGISTIDFSLFPSDVDVGER